VDKELAEYLAEKEVEVDKAVKEAGTNEEDRLTRELKADLQDIKERMDRNRVFFLSIPGKVEAAEATRRTELDMVLATARDRVARHKATAEASYPMLLEYGRKAKDGGRKVDLDKEPEVHDSDMLRKDMERLGMIL
jgi:hypothetical protein